LYDFEKRSVFGTRRGRINIPGCGGGSERRKNG